jgi:hypothetical protein
MITLSLLTGAVRDERLNRMWNLKKVKFVRPSEEQGKERFFNIFVLHQVNFFDLYILSFTS